MEFNRDTYREYGAINFSRLAQVDRNPSKVDEEKDWHDGFAFGSLVDVMCFEPTRVEDEFYVNEADREPSGTAKKLADWILENKDDAILNNIVFDWVKEEDDPKHGYGLGGLIIEAEEAVGSSTDFEKYGGVDYLKSQIESQDKKVVSEELYDKARQATRTLKTHEFTRDYFNDNRSHIEIQNQVPVLWNPSYYEEDLDVMAKSLLDIVIFDHEEETILPVDLKTTSSSVFMFERKMTKWRYYLQASYYSDGLRYRVDIHEDISDYDLLPFEFVVISSKNLQTPLIYPSSKSDLKVGREGGTLKYNGKEVRGWIQLIKDLKWHEQEGKWDYPREVYENDGKIELDIFE